MTQFEAIWNYPLIRLSSGIEITVGQISLTLILILLGLLTRFAAVSLILITGVKIKHFFQSEHRQIRALRRANPDPLPRVTGGGGHSPLGRRPPLATSSALPRRMPKACGG